MARRIVLACFLFAIAACGEAQTLDDTYGGTARRHYQLGMEAFEDDDFLEAQRHFNLVRNKYAYSQYAALAELRIADSWFEQDKFAEAIEGYRSFAQNRPNHREVPYAMWRMGVSNFEQIPSGFVLFPPVHEKDQVSTKDTLAVLRRYTERFPDHTHAGEARKMISSCRGLMADHELYVARFYLRDSRPNSARGRLETLLADFEDVREQWATAGVLLVEVYLELEMRDEAVQTVERLATKLGESAELSRARAFIAEAR